MSGHARPLRNDVQRYYEGSNRELGRRYVTEAPFLSREYCAVALDHRYRLYPFIQEFVDFGSWAGKRVLEVGCGHGADLSEFARHGARAYGCDLTYKHCAISREFVRCAGGRSEIVQAEAGLLPYRSSFFDLVYAFGVLLLVEDLDGAIAEIRRVLKPGGTVIAMFYNRLSLHYYLKTLYYYGIVCDLETLLGPRRLVDWFTDGYEYPRTYHQTRSRLREAFGRFQIERLVVRNFTPDQLPQFELDRYPPAFWSWMASRVGFYLMLRARK